MAGQFASRPEVGWHWNGQLWCPVSPDGGWYWDSYAFQWKAMPPGNAASPPRPTLASWFKNIPLWLRWTWLGWSVALVTWVPVLVGAGSHHAYASEMITLAAIFGGASVLATVTTGVILGYRKAWGYLGWSILVGTMALGLIIWFSFASAEPMNGQDDPGMGIGAMLVTAMCVPPLALFLTFGGGLGTLLRRIR